MTPEELAKELAPIIKKFTDAHTMGGELTFDPNEFENVPKIFSAAGIGPDELMGLLECTMAALDENFVIPLGRPILET